MNRTEKSISPWRKKLKMLQMEKICIAISSIVKWPRISTDSMQFMAFFIKLWGNNPKSCTGPQNSQTILRKKSRAKVSGSLILNYPAQLQSLNHAGDGRKTHKSMEQNREPGKFPCLIGRIHFQQGRKEYSVGKDSLFNKPFWKTWQPSQGKQSHWLLFHKIYKNKLKMD